MNNQVVYTLVEDLDYLLSQDYSTDSWYDEGFLFARELLDKFTEHDWNEIIILSEHRDVEWEKKIVYCVNKDYYRGLDLIRKIIKSNDRELKEMCIDSLRDYDSDVLRRYFREHDELNDCIHGFDANDSIIGKKIMDDLMARTGLL